MWRGARGVNCRVENVGASGFLSVHMSRKQCLRKSQLEVVLDEYNSSTLEQIIHVVVGSHDAIIVFIHQKRRRVLFSFSTMMTFDFNIWYILVQMRRGRRHVSKPWFYESTRSRKFPADHQFPRRSWQSIIWFKIPPCRKKCTNRLCDSRCTVKRPSNWCRR